MRVRYLGESSPLMLINGKSYDVISIEDGWYRIVDETDEDEAFDVVEPNDGSTPSYTLEELRQMRRQRGGRR